MSEKARQITVHFLCMSPDQTMPPALEHHDTTSLDEFVSALSTLPKALDSFLSRTISQLPGRLIPTP